jgi:hypothetical protein
VKENKVDLAIVKLSMRTLVTVKWSVRADREKQLTADYDEYIKAESSNKKFEYVFITNEFDPARLIRACENIYRNSSMFDRVVHINPEAVKHTYSGSNGNINISQRKVIELIDSNRIVSLSKWIYDLSNQS